MSRASVTGDRIASVAQRYSTTRGRILESCLATGASKNQIEWTTGSWINRQLVVSGRRENPTRRVEDRRRAMPRAARFLGILSSGMSDERSFRFGFPLRDTATLGLAGIVSCPSSAGDDRNAICAELTRVQTAGQSVYSSLIATTFVPTSRNVRARNAPAAHVPSCAFKNRRGGNASRRGFISPSYAAV